MRALPVLRSLAERAARAPDRILHRYRRRLLLRTFQRRGRPASVLVVCHGNICRSPFAAGLLTLMLPADLRGVIPVRSAGFVGAGRPSPRAAVEAAAERGVDLSRHRATVLTPALVRAAQVIVVMDAVQRREVCALYRRHPSAVALLGDLDPRGGETREIQDPLDRPAAVYRATYDRISRCVEQLVHAMVSAQPGRVPEEHT